MRNSQIKDEEGGKRKQNPSQFTLCFSSVQIFLGKKINRLSFLLSVLNLIILKVLNGTVKTTNLEKERLKNERTSIFSIKLH